jgi:hypothetical protein
VNYIPRIIRQSLLFFLLLPLWSIGHPWNVLFQFSPLILYTVGRTSWTVNQPISRPLRTKNNTDTINADIHALSGMRTHDPSVRRGEDSLCLRPCGHCDRVTRGCLLTVYINQIYNDASGQENRINDRGDPLRWPRDTLYPQKLALTSPTTGGRSVGIVRLRTKGRWVSHNDAYLWWGVSVRITMQDVHPLPWQSPEHNIGSPSGPAQGSAAAAACGVDPSELPLMLSRLQWGALYSLLSTRTGLSDSDFSVLQRDQSVNRTCGLLCSSWMELYRNNCLIWMLSQVCLLRYNFLTRLHTNFVMWVRNTVTFLHVTCRGPSTEHPEYYDIYCGLLSICTVTKAVNLFESRIRLNNTQNFISHFTVKTLRLHYQDQPINITSRNKY